MADGMWRRGLLETQETNPQTCTVRLEGLLSDMKLLIEQSERFIWTKTLDKVPKISEIAHILETYFTECGEKVQALNSTVPIQWSIGFRSRARMADAIVSDVYSLIGLGGSAVLQPDVQQQLC